MHIYRSLISNYFNYKQIETISLTIMYIALIAQTWKYNSSSDDLYRRG